jgi:hypothetical protein
MVLVLQNECNRIEWDRKVALPISGIQSPNVVPARKESIVQLPWGHLIETSYVVLSFYEAAFALYSKLQNLSGNMFIVMINIIH